MTISDRIFEILKSKEISQKDFSDRTGIPQSTISDWKKKGTNPASDKIMAICDVLDVSPYTLLTGIDAAGERTNRYEYRIIGNNTEECELFELYNSLDTKMKNRVMGYIKALTEIGNYES